MKFYLTHTTKPSDSEDFLCSSSPRNCSALIPLSTAVTAIFPHQHKNKNPQKPIKSNSNKIQFCDTPFTTPTLIRNGHVHTHLYKLKFWASVQWPFDRRGCHQRPRHEPLRKNTPARHRMKRHRSSPSPKKEGTKKGGKAKEKEWKKRKGIP